MSSLGKPPKWKILENVVTAIERSLTSVPGTQVIPNASIPERISGVLRQMDVYVEIPTGPRILRIGIEVRDKSIPLDLPEVEQLIMKLKKLDLDFGCIVSQHGFTTTASEEAKRNGIELRTVTEIERPNWWLASGMIVEYRQVELLHFQVNFQPEEQPHVSPLLAEVKGIDLVLTFENGNSGSLPNFIRTQGVHAINQPELASLKDQDTFTVTIDFSNLGDAHLSCPHGPLPLPQSIYASYRLHHCYESVPLTSYEGSVGVDVFTGIATNWNKQISIVAKPESDGSRTLSFMANNPKPSKTVISQRK